MIIKFSITETGKYRGQDVDNPQYFKESNSFEKVREWVEDMLNDFETENELEIKQTKQISKSFDDKFPAMDFFKMLGDAFAPKKEIN